ncbi:class I SAM-dependent methyltransferase [Pseudoalteromonas sp. Of7M-16]|uniref:class I SAM-dependent methyltransferase n=1 Tax=Pseudoalteromonas sp. Of7M-16 TaxID=2917756 RepID=UPI001EF56BFC|nr:class I SAM-dependent methyltransferase [Pseudoalteromonas sp. Of7M-16]MCG7547485.1 class I SAM-dependent methyltransferase [Pseudoalteromonas sp. Of7M-16]
MWDERYDTDEYAYGIEPNNFLREQFKMLPKGRILSLAEGEGRNAIFLAKQGYCVTAVDSSTVGLEKAKKLAKANNVSIECIHADLSEFNFGEDCWDGIISIFCPLPSKLRELVHFKVESGLRLGGVFLTESYTPNQLQYGTGGGDCIDTMQTKESLTKEFKRLKFSHLIETERDVIEGTFHTGLASVVQAIGKKCI